MNLSPKFRNVVFNKSELYFFTFKTEECLLGSNNPTASAIAILAPSLGLK